MYYQKFKDLVAEAYDCLRRYATDIMTILLLLVHAKPAIEGKLHSQKKQETYAFNKVLLQVRKLRVLYCRDSDQGKQKKRQLNNSSMRLQKHTRTILNTLPTWATKWVKIPR
jgi:hypothetical protein